MSIRELIDCLSIAIQVSLVLNLILWIYGFKSLPDKVKRLGPFIIITLIIEFYSAYLSEQSRSNLFLLHIYTLIEFLAWSFFYGYLFEKKKNIQRYFYWFVGLVCALLFSNTLFLEPLTGFNSNSKTLVQFILINYAIYYFFSVFGKINLTNPLPRSLSLISFAVLLYYSGSLFIFMFSKLLANNDVEDSQQYSFWAINGSLYVIFLILIFISLWTVTFRKTRS